MPKVEENDFLIPRLTIEDRTELRQKFAVVNVTGKEVEDIEIILDNEDRAEPSYIAADIAALLSRTPNLKNLTIKFNGHLCSSNNCFPVLPDVLCSLTKLESFIHEDTRSSELTLLSQYELMRCVSAWTNLRELYIAGDIRHCSQADLDKCAALPPATCKLEYVTLQRCMASYSSLAPIFAGCAGSSRLELEIWSMGIGEIDDLIRPTLPGLASLRLGGYKIPTAHFIANELSRAPKLTHLHLYGSYNHSAERRALAAALGESARLNAALAEDADTKANTTAEELAPLFPALRSLNYPAVDGTHGTGRGNAYRVREYRNSGEDDLKKAAAERGIEIRRARDIKYRGERAQRRVGNPTMSRSWY